MTMTESQALEEVARLAAFWPHTPPETIAAHAAALLGEELADVQLARHTISEAWRGPMFPAPAFILEHVRMAKRARLQEERLALPAAKPLDHQTKRHLGGPELGRRFHRLRVGLFGKGLRGDELREFCEEPQECDADEPEDPAQAADAAGRAAAAAMVGSEGVGPEGA